MSNKVRVLSGERVEKNDINRVGTYTDTMFKELLRYIAGGRSNDLTQIQRSNGGVFAFPFIEQDPDELIDLTTGVSIYTSSIMRVYNYFDPHDTGYRIVGAVAAAPDYFGVMGHVAHDFPAGSTFEVIGSGAAGNDGVYTVHSTVETLDGYAATTAIRVTIPIPTTGVLGFVGRLYPAEGRVQKQFIIDGDGQFIADYDYGTEYIDYNFAALANGWYYPYVYHQVGNFQETKVFYDEATSTETSTTITTVNYDNWNLNQVNAAAAAGLDLYANTLVATVEKAAGPVYHINCGLWSQASALQKGTAYRLGEIAAPSGPFTNYDEMLEILSIPDAIKGLMQTFRDLRDDTLAKDIWCRAQGAATIGTDRLCSDNPIGKGVEPDYGFRYYTGGDQYQTRYYNIHPITYIFDPTTGATYDLDESKLHVILGITKTATCFAPINELISKIGLLEVDVWFYCVGATDANTIITIDLIKTSTSAGTNTILASAVQNGVTIATTYQKTLTPAAIESIDTGSYFYSLRFIINTMGSAAQANIYIYGSRLTCYVNEASLMYLT